MESLIRKILLMICLGVSSLACAHDGCYYQYENAYLNVGAVRGNEKGEIMCSKLPNGAYIWVAANDFDMSNGCWYKDKYPVLAIVEMGKELRQCVVNKDGCYKWVPYHKKS